MATATGLAATALIGLLTLLAVARRGRAAPPPPVTGAGSGAATDSGAGSGAGSDEHPESLTTVLEPGVEEYLAWLADDLWPADEYLDLELEWRNELPSAEFPEPYEKPRCPHCLLRREDVWPCPQCGRLLHSSCGHGMRRRRLAHPYRTRATDPQAVIAEWLCTGCLSVVGLDVDHGDEADDDLRR